MKKLKDGKHRTLLHHHIHISKTKGNHAILPTRMSRMVKFHTVRCYLFPSVGGNIQKQYMLQSHNYLNFSPKSAPLKVEVLSSEKCFYLEGRCSWWGHSNRNQRLRSLLMEIRDPQIALQEVYC